MDNFKCDRQFWSIVLHKKSSLPRIFDLVEPTEQIDFQFLSLGGNLGFLQKSLITSITVVNVKNILDILLNWTLTETTRTENLKYLDNFWA